MNETLKESENPNVAKNITTASRGGERVCVCVSRVKVEKQDERTLCSVERKPKK